MSRELVAVDLGGTNARFAIATVDAGRVISLGEPVTFQTAAFASFETAWQSFSGEVGRALPDAAAVAVAGPAHGEVIELTNNPWVIRPALLAEKLGLDQFLFINDFEAIGHAVAHADDDQFLHLAGPEGPLPREGVISIIGPGTGLGVGLVLRGASGYRVVPTEGGHIDFAPHDVVEDAILSRLRQRHRRVSAERVVSGPAISDIYDTLASLEGKPTALRGDIDIWTAGMAGTDNIAAAAVDRFCLSLGSFAGDIALAQGGKALIVAGGLGQRLKDVLPKSGFARRFHAKGRFESMMQQIPVRLITYPQPGLFGATAAFAQRYAEPLRQRSFPRARHGSFQA